MALLIANGSYFGIPGLSQPKPNVERLSKILASLGFTVTERFDMNQGNLEQAVTQFGRRVRKLRSDDIALFYYTGYAVQVYSENYLVPVNVEVSDKDTFSDTIVSLAPLVSDLRSSKGKLTLVIIDGSREDNSALTFLALMPGLSAMSAPQNSIIAFAAEPGRNTLANNDAVSRYTRALSKTLATSDRPIGEILELVKRSISRETNYQQIPWYAASEARVS